MNLLAQTVGPVYPFPPHCPYALCVDAGAVGVVVVGGGGVVVGGTDVGTDVGLVVGVDVGGTDVGPVGEVVGGGVAPATSP